MAILVTVRLRYDEDRYFWQCLNCVIPLLQVVTSEHFLMQHANHNCVAQVTNHPTFDCLGIIQWIILHSIISFVVKGFQNYRLTV